MGMPGVHGVLIIAYGTRESQHEGAGEAMHDNGFCVYEQY